MFSVWSDFLRIGLFKLSDQSVEIQTHQNKKAFTSHIQYDFGEILKKRDRNVNLNVFSQIGKSVRNVFSKKQSDM